MHQTASKSIYIIELAAAKPTIRYTYFKMLFCAVGLVSSTVSLINSNCKVHVIFTWADVKIIWFLELLLFRITDHLACGKLKLLNCRDKICLIIHVEASEGVCKRLARRSGDAGGVITVMPV